jgi:hypothetical protein
MPDRPPLSVIIPARGGPREAAATIAALDSPATALGAEVVVVGNTAEGAGGIVRAIAVEETDVLALRKRAVEESRGAIVAIGEDHAVPRPDWCEAVVRAHAEHPEAAAVAGCLVNATDSTMVGRANFLAFATPWQPPMPSLPSGRPPPTSTLSFKREALAGIEERPPGWLEADLLPALFEQGRLAADDRIVVDHYQDHGVWWTIRNAYDSARASYGYRRSDLDPAGRRRLARWAIRGVPRQLSSEHRARPPQGRRDGRETALIAVIRNAAGLGATLGPLLGPGRSGERVA